MELYIKWYIKDKKGTRKQIYNKADNTGISTALHLTDILVKYRQVNPYINSYSKR